MKPIVLEPGKFDASDLEHLKVTNKIWRINDIYEQQLQELAEITHPSNNQAQEAFIADKPKDNLSSTWVYYPWSGILLRCVGPDDLFKLRTNRNQNIISSYEQTKLADNVVGVAGMSVGSGMALSCVYSGMSNTIKLADFDSLETANLNRLRESLINIGEHKAILTARHVYELNPFANVTVFDQGLNDKNIDAFFNKPAVNIVVDEIDDFKMKVQLRLKAKENKVPLLMFTSLGDNILVDVERYDIDPNLTIFNGAIGDIPQEILSKDTLSIEDIKRYSVQLVGQEYVPTKALASLSEIGKTLVGRPQLYSTIAVDGGLAAYLIKAILLGEKVTSGRYFIKFAELFGMSSGDLLDDGEK
jgi:molybdopterin/thiamine biosynthesis adenylyltransferase